MRTLILCGGKGLRAYPHSLDVPKPLLEVGERPVLAQVMEVFARQGFTEFVLAAGFKADRIATFAYDLPGEWNVEVHDTGEDAPTGQRVARCMDHMGETFFVTYGDGVGNVDLIDLLEFHRGHPGAVTMTTVPLPSPYGTVETTRDGAVRHFREKPRLADHWINAGFFIFESRAREWFVGGDLERETLPALAEAGELYAYRHHGFWSSLDTYKDAIELGALADQPGGPPWLHLPAPSRVMAL